MGTMVFTFWFTFAATPLPVSRRGPGHRPAQAPPPPVLSRPAAHRGGHGDLDQAHPRRRAPDRGRVIIPVGAEGLPRPRRRIEDGIWPQRRRCWGTSTPQPFHIDIPQAELDDLAARLARTRWPDELPGPGGTTAWRGTGCANWRRTGARGNDWHAGAARLNTMPQSTTVIDRQQVHFLHARGLPGRLNHPEFAETQHNAARWTESQRGGDFAELARPGSPGARPAGVLHRPGTDGPSTLPATAAPKEAPPAATTATHSKATVP